jgi:hypothetical protein
MSIEKLANETLRHLFQQYLKNPAVVYSIQQVTKHHNECDAIQLSDYLLENSWIRERWVFPDNNVTCRITIKGIEHIDAVYVREKLSQVIGGLVDAGGERTLMDILEYKIEEYSIALDLVKQLEVMNLVELRHDGDNIVIVLTTEGRKFYERNGRSMLTLMAY